MKSVFIATPMFGGQCYGTYALSVMDLIGEFHRRGINYTISYIYNESLINRARNKLVATFLKTNFTHLLFIDADIGFNKEDVIKLLEYDHPVMGAVYPKKSIAWDHIKEALEKGLSPDVAFRHRNDYVGNVEDDDEKNIVLNDYNQPLRKFKYIGTGFMLIAREVFEKLTPHVEIFRISQSTEAMANFFSLSIEESHNVLLSEDYDFCEKCKKHGIPIYVAPWIKLSHTGTYTFGI